MRAGEQAGGLLLTELPLPVGPADSSGAPLQKLPAAACSSIDHSQELHESEGTPYQEMAGGAQPVITAALAPHCCGPAHSRPALVYDKPMHVAPSFTCKSSVFVPALLPAVLFRYFNAGGPKAYSVLTVRTPASWRRSLPCSLM